MPRRTLKLNSKDADRELILLRRRTFVASALAGLSATACDKINPFQPCLSPAPVDVGTSAASPGVSASSPGSSGTHPVLSKAVTKIVGRATVDTLLRAKDGEVFRVNAKDFVQGSKAADRFSGYKIEKKGRSLKDTEMRKLARFLLAESSYGPDEKYLCDNSESYGLRVKHTAEIVELLFTFPCNRVAFLRRARADGKMTPGEYIDPVGRQVRDLLRAVM